jgi:hypothetical protein
LHVAWDWHQRSYVGGVFARKQSQASVAEELPLVKYCDTKVLEGNWFHWLLGSSVPDLEVYRRLGLLWTRVEPEENVVEGTKKAILPNPRHPRRGHCIALATPVFFSSDDGIVQSFGTVASAEKIPLPFGELSLLSDSWLHNVDNLFAQRDIVQPMLLEQGYIKEKITDEMWHLLLFDISKICQGVAMKFNQPSDEEHLELSHEALLQVINKLKTYKLVYTPGRAPVFNLLTTTIHRCMYSIMNRRKTQREGLRKYQDDIQTGTVVPQQLGGRRGIKTHLGSGVK